MAAVAGRTGTSSSPSYADPMQDSRWEIVTPPSRSPFPQHNTFQPQLEQRPMNATQWASSGPAHHEAINAQSTPTAFSRHSLHGSSFQPAELPGSLDNTRDQADDINYEERAQRAEVVPAYTNGEDNVEEEDMTNKWIHRDKLAEIETKELEEIGKRLGLPLRAISGSGNVQDPREALSGSAQAEDDGTPMSKRLHVDTSRDGYQDENETEELAYSTNGASSHSRTLSVKRAGKSRIPVSKSSPLARTAPFSSLGDTDSPNSLRQGNGQQWRGSINSMNGTRAQSALPAPRSSIANDEDRPTSSNAKAFEKMTTSGRNNSISQQRARAASNAGKRNSWRRPSTSDSRPRTPVNRPEGDAPWISTMFAPDPRLPPDQQMLPTHAKRLAMERGERVMTNEELLELEIREAKKAEGGYQSPPLQSSPATVKERPSGGITSRPSIKKMFSRNSVHSARHNQSQVNTPKRSTDFNAGPPYQNGQNVLHNQASSMDYVRQVQNRQPSRSGAPPDNMAEWPLPSPKVIQEKEFNAGMPRTQQNQGNASNEKPGVARVPESQQGKQEKKKGGCAGCCIVM